VDPSFLGPAVIGVLGSILGAASGARVLRVRRWKRFFEDKAGFRVEGVAHPRVLWTPRVGTRLKLDTVVGNSRDGMSWTVFRWPSPLGGRMALSVTRKGLGWTLLSMVGLASEQSGVPELDAAHHFATSDPALLRGLLKEPLMRHALEAFFLRAGATARVDVRAAHAVVGARGDNMSPQSALSLLMATDALCRAMEHHANVEPLDPPPAPLFPDGKGALGGGAGLPVAISLEGPARKRDA
jgi:hypothetical protein